MNDRRADREPFWNDGDKMGGLFATIALGGVAIAIAIVVISLAAKFAIWLLV